MTAKKCAIYRTKILVSFCSVTRIVNMATSDILLAATPQPVYPLRERGLGKLANFVKHSVGGYARTRNYDEGVGGRTHVSCLSSYIRNRVLTESEVVKAVLQQHTYTRVEKFIQEVFWRTYWKGWLEMRPAVWNRYCEERTRLEQQCVDNPNYHAAIAGETGIPCMDAWIHELVTRGYLHNHARMWFASIWIFTLQLPWQLGAHFFMRHLLDGDPATNTLSWRWVAGLHTRGKHYVARSSNIAKYTRGRWCPDSLNEAATPLTDEASLPEPLWIQLSDPDHLANKTFGLLVTDDDVAVDQAWMQRACQVMSVFNQQAYTELSFATNVVAHRQHSLQQSTEAWAAKRGVAVEHQEHLSVHRIVQWAVDAKLECIAMIQPTVGFANHWATELESELAKENIEWVACRKPWDEKLFPHATKGFFAFKKVIPKIIEGISA